VRDAHLGSIWEGTSNIVALDVVRSMRKERTLEAIVAHVEGQLDAARMPAAVSDAFGRALASARTLAQRACESDRADLARQAASGLYHLTTAAGLAREATQAALPRRLLLAQMVLRHRLLPRDPLADDGREAGVLAGLLSESPSPAADGVPLIV
jgi:hypothetical protein